MTDNMFVPLSAEEIATIENGGHIRKIFGCGLPLRVVVLHDATASYKQIKDEYSEIWKAGDDLINFPIDKNGIKTLREGKNALSRSYKNKKTDTEYCFEIVVITEEMHKQLSESRDGGASQ